MKLRFLYIIERFCSKRLFVLILIFLISFYGIAYQAARAPYMIYSEIIIYHDNNSNIIILSDQVKNYDFLENNINWLHILHSNSVEYEVSKILKENNVVSFIFEKNIPNGEYVIKIPSEQTSILNYFLKRGFNYD